MTKRKYLSSDEVAEICRRYKYETSTVLGLEFGVHESCIRKHAGKIGIKKKQGAKPVVKPLQLASPIYIDGISVRVTHGMVLCEGNVLTHRRA